MAKGVYKRSSKKQLSDRRRTYEELLTRTAEEKVALTEAIIAQALQKGPGIVLYSGGKDSTVLLDLVLKQAPGIRVMYNDTTLGDHRTRDYIRARCQALNYIETTAEDPIEMWQRTGYYPILSKRGFTAYKKADQGLRVSPVQCCYQLKEKYAYPVKMAEGIKVAFWGNRATESMRRRLTFLDNGYLFKPKRYNWWQAYPLQHWTDHDIAEYLTTHVKDHPTTEEFETGCLCCGTDITFYPNNLSRLYHQDPEAWKIYMRAGFAEQIMRLNGIIGRPEEIIRLRPEELLRVKRKPATKAQTTEKQEATV